MKVRSTPCSNCPWRRGIACAEIPGGGMDAGAMKRASHGRMGGTVMLCHEEHQNRVCAGFALRGTRDHLPWRTALSQGLIELTVLVEPPEPLFDGWDELIAARGGRRYTP